MKNDSADLLHVSARFAAFAALIFVSLGITFGTPSSSHAMEIKPPVTRERPVSTPVSMPVAGSVTGLVTTPEPVVTPIAPATATSNPAARTSSTRFKALWTGSNSDAANWTTHMEDALNSYGANLLKGPSDIDSFCPMYSRLGHQDQINFWVQLFAGVAKYESGFNPTSHMVETTMGHDPITGSQVISAGLFQLSYQDTPLYKSHVPPGVCVFDYRADSKLSMTDLKRTINDPKTNITCAVSIMNYLVSKHGAIAYDFGNYWSTLMPSSKHGKVPQIKAITRALTFCEN